MAIQADLHHVQEFHVTRRRSGPKLYAPAQQANRASHRIRVIGKLVACIGETVLHTGHFEVVALAADSFALAIVRRRPQRPDLEPTPTGLVLLAGLDVESVSLHLHMAARAGLWNRLLAIPKKLRTDFVGSQRPLRA